MLLTAPMTLFYIFVAPVMYIGSIRVLPLSRGLSSYLGHPHVVVHGLRVDGEDHLHGPRHHSENQRHVRVRCGPEKYSQ